MITYIDDKRESIARWKERCCIVLDDTSISVYCRLLNYLAKGYKGTAYSGEYSVKALALKFREKNEK